MARPASHHSPLSPRTLQSGLCLPSVPVSSSASCCGHAAPTKCWAHLRRAAPTAQMAPSTPSSAQPARSVLATATEAWPALPVAGAVITSAAKASRTLRCLRRHPPQSRSWVHRRRQQRAAPTVRMAPSTPNSAHLDKSVIAIATEA